ncbi:MFS transporter (plasmid) [Arthrobacter sp. G.S.26]|uniref:MFS transporter n=1 Tax=Arthrobacter sp. G.S.26 TaxID=3433706 RepID=UPI003D76F509
MFPGKEPGKAGVREPTTSSEAKFPLGGLLALSAAIFVSMATEFLPGGLIPNIAAEFGLSPGEVGNLITVFALTVILTAAPFAAVTRRLPRKTMLLIAFGLIGLGNLGMVLAPSFESMLAARVVGACAHGAFWSVAAAYAAHIVRPVHLGKATAVIAAGGSVAGVVGLPLGNALGQAFGWRVSFAGLAGLVVIVFFLIAWQLPAAPSLNARTGLATSRVYRDRSWPAVMMICLIIVLAVGAQTSFGTFNVLWLLDVVRIAPPAVPVLLFVGGVASALGVALIGAFYNKMPGRLFLGSIAVLVVLLFALPTIAHSQLAVWVVSAVMALVFAGVPVMLQIRMMLTASANLRNLAAALQTTAFNVGIGGGALLGGIAIDRTSLGAIPTWAGIAMGLAFATAAFWELAVHRRNRQ